MSAARIACQREHLKGKINEKCEYHAPAEIHYRSPALANYGDALVSRGSIYRDSRNDCQTIQDNLMDFGAYACRFRVHHYDEKAQE